MPSAIRRSKDDLKPFGQKSYATNIKFGYEIVSLSELINKKELLEGEGRAVMHEHKVQGAQYAIKIFDKKGNSITVNQIRDIFDDLGFNVDVAFTEIFEADIVIVYNIGGFIIPLWRYLIIPIIKYKPYYKNLLLTKLSPGKKRLHIRIFHNTDACWYLIAHVDNSNWLNFLNPFDLIKSHFTKAAGNYALGHKIMMEVFETFAPLFNRQKRFYVDIEKVYKNILASDLKRTD